MEKEKEEQKPTLKFVYRNWQGETREREVVPIQIWYGHTDYHKEDQWFLKALDIGKDAERDFALKDIQKFLSLQGETLRS